MLLPVLTTPPTHIAFIIYHISRITYHFNRYDMLFTTGTLTRPQLLRFCNCITSHCSSKDHVGSVLSIFTKDMSMQEAVTIVHGIVTSRCV